MSTFLIKDFEELLKKENRRLVGNNISVNFNTGITTYMFQTIQGIDVGDSHLYEFDFSRTPIFPEFPSVPENMFSVSNGEIKLTRENQLYLQCCELQDKYDDLNAQFIDRENKTAIEEKKDELNQIKLKIKERRSWLGNTEGITDFLWLI